MLNRSSTVRTPAYGVIPPAGSITVAIEKPLRYYEVPVVITRQPGLVRVRNMTRTSIVVDNQSALPVGYVMVVVPHTLYKIASLPWQQAISMLSSQQGRQVIWQRLIAFLKASDKLPRPR